MGTRDDATRLVAFLGHPNVRIRGEVWRALAALDPDSFTARADQLRADPSGKVAATFSPDGESAPRPIRGKATCSNIDVLLRFAIDNFLFSQRPC